MREYKKETYINLLIFLSCVLSRSEGVNYIETEKDQSIAKENTQENAQETTITQENIQEKIIEMIKEEPTVTKNILATRLNTTPDSIKYYLNKMRKNGLIKHKGPTKSGHWEIIE